MGKASRIVILTITIVLTVFVFAGMWVFRPEAESTVLESARQRQSTPLVNVQEPLETDLKVLSEEEEFELKVRELLAADPDFIERVSQSTRAAILSDDEFVSDIGTKVVAGAEKTAEEIVSARVEAHEEKIASENEALRSEIWDETTARLEAALDTDSLAEVLIPPVTEAVWSDVSDRADIDTDAVTRKVLAETEKERRAAIEEVLAEASKETEAALSEFDERGRELTNEVKRMLADFSPSIDEKEIRSIVKEEMAAAEQRMTEDVTGTVTQKVLAEVDDIITQRINDELPKYRQMAPGIVSAPKLSGISVPESEYVSVRTSVREDAINSLLEKLQN
ncbi:MAG: hypothetical protein ACI4NM_00185 [Bullifex sp.]